METVVSYLAPRTCACAFNLFVEEGQGRSWVAGRKRLAIVVVNLIGRRNSSSSSGSSKSKKQRYKLGREKVKERGRQVQ